MNDKYSAIFGIVDPTGARGYFLVQENGEPDKIFNVISSCLALPECHRPPMSAYDNHVQLLALASIAGVDFVYEMGFENGKPTLMSAMGMHANTEDLIASLYLVTQKSYV